MRHGYEEDMDITSICLCFCEMRDFAITTKYHHVGFHHVAPHVGLRTAGRINQVSRHLHEVMKNSRERQTSQWLAGQQATSETSGSPRVISMKWQGPGMEWQGSHWTSVLSYRRRNDAGMGRRRLEFLGHDKTEDEQSQVLSIDL